MSTLRKAVDQLSIPHPTSKVANMDVVTNSGRFASVKVGINITSGELIKRVDEALYKAKDDGRNRVVVWRPLFKNWRVASLLK